MPTDYAGREERFNSASWGGIIQELRRKNISTHFISSYLSNRKIKMEGIEMEVSAGVPQGSGLGPTLWNILYDGVLRLVLPPGVEVISFADDLRVVVRADDIPTINSKARRTLETINEWLVNHFLTLAPEKTEAVILKGPRKREGICFDFQGTRVVPGKAVRYLGITLASQGTFGEHIKRTVK